MATRTRRDNHDGTAPRQRADGRWTIKVRWIGLDGKPQRTSVYGRTRPEVAKKARELRGRLDKGKPAVDAQVTLGAYVERWIDGPLAASVATGNRKRSTATWYANVARRQIVASSLGGLPLRNVTPERVEAWLVELAARPGHRGGQMAPSTLRACHTVLGAVMERARQDGLVAVNAAHRVSRPKVEHHDVRCLTAAEVRTLLAAAEGSRYLPLLRLLAMTGMRRGEAMALHWADVDLNAGELHIRRTLGRVASELTTTPPKSQRSRRRIKVDASVVELLRDVKARTAREPLRAGSKWTASPFVFVTEFGGPVEPRNVARQLTVCAARAGLDGVTLHTLRHTAASLMLAAGVPLLEVSRHLGHASTDITSRVYGHVLPDYADRAAGALAAALAG